MPVGETYTRNCYVSLEIVYWKMLKEKRNIIKANDDYNLCLYYCMLNSLGTEKERLAFSGRDLSTGSTGSCAGSSVPHEKFHEVVLANCPLRKKDTVDSGLVHAGEKKKSKISQMKGNTKARAWTIVKT